MPPPDGVRAVAPDELAAIAVDDPLWAHGAAISVGPVPAYRLGGGLAVRHRIGRIDGWCVSGDPADSAELFRVLLATGTFDGASVPWASYPLLTDDLDFTVVDRWDFRWTDVVPAMAAEPGEWLPGDDGDVQSFLDVAFPTAAVQTGDPAVRRWAALRDDGGRLLACAADASHAPTLGFVSSIATAPQARGRGVGTRLTAWVTAELVREHGRAGLWVDHPNLAGRAVYDRCGYRDEHRMVWLEPRLTG